MSATASTKLDPSLKNWSKKILAPQPTQPWHQDHKKGGGTHFLRRREQCSKKDNTVLHPQGKLANCGGLQKASVCGVLEFKPHLRGSLGQGPKPAEACCPKARGHEAKSLTSTGMLPHCKKQKKKKRKTNKKKQTKQNGGLVATLSLKQWKNSTTPPACAPNTERFQ